MSPLVASGTAWTVLEIETVKDGLTRVHSPLSRGGVWGLLRGRLGYAASISR